MKLHEKSNIHSHVMFILRMHYEVYTNSDKNANERIDNFTVIFGISSIYRELINSNKLFS